MDLDQARLLVAKADNDLQSAFANLSTVLGERQPESFDLAEEPMPELVTNSAPDLIMEALANRPDLARIRYQRDAAKEFALSEKKLSYPTLSAIATGGLTPVGDSRLGDNYAAAGVNLNFPLFTGGLYQARRREAELRADAADQTVRDQEDTIARDTQISKLNLDYAFDASRADRAAAAKRQPGVGTGADALSQQSQFHRGVEPGRVEPNHRSN